MNPRAEELIANLNLAPHPEGGFYRRMYQTATMVTPSDGRGQRHAMTAIYYLLTNDTVSRWHQVKSDEAWHLYEGGPLDLFELDPSTGEMSRHHLAQGEATPAHVVAAGNWQAARSAGDYTLMYCTVSPGFDFADFQLLLSDSRLADQIRAHWPDLVELIR